jgi:serine protease AprX
MTKIFFAVVVFISLVQSPVMVIAGDKIHPWLDKKSASGQEMEFLVIMKEGTDLSSASQLKSKAEKGRFVHGELMRSAAGAQGPIREWLKAHGVKHRVFHIVNAILVKGDRKLMDALAARDDVERIEGNPEIRNYPPLQEAAPAITSSTTGVEWNLSQVGAPDLWALGIRGDGIVIGGSDTGYRWTHEALKAKYRGWNGTSADHNYNWHDAIHTGGGSCGADSSAPCDDYGHGTHTMGTVVGDDGGGNQIGVAPGAKWIGCRNMNVGVGSPATYLECFEFFLAPYPIGGAPEQGDPAKAPDLTVNSWHCPSSEGCLPLTLETAVNNMKAAGIMTVVSAGNSSFSCGTIVDPPAIYGSAYTVGSTASNYTLSPFSSRGPAGTTGLMKPDIVAPGSSVRSAYNASDSSYTTMDGTSMAAPHVAGGVALIWSAAPALRNDQDATAALLNGSAMKLTSIVEGCVGDYTNGPNNSWGNGLLDLHSAYDSTTFNLNVNLQGTGSGIVGSAPAGIHCPGGCSHRFGSGVEVTLRAAPGDYSIFSGWTGACTGNLCEVTMATDREVTALFDLDMPHSTRIDLPAQADYPSLTAAYGAAASGAVISAWGITFHGDLVCGEEKAITLKGGYDQNYFPNGGFTSIHGKVELRKGSMTVERMIIL